jgi:hypothetical protein
VTFSEGRFGRGSRALLALAGLATILLAAVWSRSADAAKPLAPPRPGAWKLIAADNTPDGLEVTGGTIGSFRVTKSKTIAGFHLTFTEAGESTFCAGGQEFGEGKSGPVKFSPGTTAPIVKASGEWLVGVSTGSLGGGSVQGAEVSLLTPHGGSGAGTIFITLATEKKVPRSGDVAWNENQCNVAFVVKPG